MISSYRIWNALLLICLCCLWLNPASFMGLSSWQTWKNSGHLNRVLSRISNARYIKARQLKENLSKLNALWDRPAGTSAEQRTDSHMNTSSFGYLLMWTTVMRKKQNKTVYLEAFRLKLVRISQRKTWPLRLETEGCQRQSWRTLSNDVNLASRQYVTSQLSHFLHLGS